MKSILKTGLIGILICAGCAHKDERPEERTEPVPVSLNPAPDAGASIETKQAAAQANAPFSTEIVFRKGQSILSKESANRLKKLVASARKIGEIDEIQAYTWSDQEYPGEQAKKLPAKQQNLAVARGEAIRSYFAKVGLESALKVITMTERPSGLEARFKTGDTREKEAFAATGVSTTDQKTTAAPKASRAAVMIVLKR
jgi:hypothetical protein